MLILSRILSSLPLGLALWLGRVVAWAWYWLIPIRRGVALRNIERVLGDRLTPKEQRRAIRRCLDIQAMATIELLRAGHYTAEQSQRYIHPRGMEHIDAALERGSGVIVVASHVANVDLMGYSQSILGYPVCVIVKELHWGPAQRYVRAVRERTGVGLIPSRQSKEQVRQAIADNKVMCMIVDQHMAKHRAIVCKFFGRLAATSPAPARFALETGAPVVTAVMMRRGNTGHFEADPSQWLWLHKRWKVDDHPEGWDIPHELRASTSLP
jgi:KDO2-lipid IV(A) lauroyltransferase